MKRLTFRPTKTRLQVALSALFAAAVMELAVSGAGMGSVAHGADAMDKPQFQPDATVAEVMESIVMPAADVLWNSVVIYATQDGLVEEKPETDEDWQKLRWSAVNLAEATNLLLVPGRQAAAPGTPAGPGELAPKEIQALIEQNQPAWAAHAQVLHNTALQTIKIIDNKDTDGLSDIGGAIDEACESCHLQFWYPNQ